MQLLPLGGRGTLPQQAAVLGAQQAGLGGARGRGGMCKSALARLYSMCMYAHVRVSIRIYTYVYAYMCDI